LISKHNLLKAFDINRNVTKKEITNLTCDPYVSVEDVEAVTVFLFMEELEKGQVPGF
jgi:hypothetical protein